MMRLLRITVLASLGVSVTGTLASAAPPELTPPEIISAKANGKPAWVSAEAASKGLQGSGGIDWSVLGEEAYRIYEGVRNTKPPLKVTQPGQPPEYDLDYPGALPDCIHYGAAFEDHVNPPSDRTLQDVAKNARAVLRGEVVAIEPGFYRGEPNSLLVVKVIHRARAAKRFASNDLFYVVYPFARFTVGDVTFCKQDSSYPYRPAIGDRVLLFPFYEALDAEGRLLSLGPQQMIFEKRGDGLILPKRFAADETAHSLTELEDSLLENR